MTLRTLLLATDGSADAALARRAAVDLARSSGAALHLATACDPLRYAGSYSGMVLPAEVVEIYEREGRETLRAESAASRPRASPLPATISSADRPPARSRRWPAAFMPT